MLTLLTLDNHFLMAGQGMLLNSVLTENMSSTIKVINLGVSGIPECGTNSEVLQAHGLDANNIAQVIRNR